MDSAMNLTLDVPGDQPLHFASTFDGVTPAACGKEAKPAALDWSAVTCIACLEVGAEGTPAAAHRLLLVGSQLVENAILRNCP